jgi:hypothetical protein
MHMMMCVMTAATQEWMQLGLMTHHSWSTIDQPLVSEVQ